MSLSARLGDRATRRRRHRIVAISAVLGLALAGFLFFRGSGSDDASFREEANRLCAESAAEIATARGVILPATPTDAQAAEFLAGAFVDLSRARVASLAALAVEGDDADRLAELLAQYTAAIDQVEADPERFVGRPGPFTQLNERLVDFGLDECVG